MKLLDTTFLIDYWAGEEAVASYLSSTPAGTEYVTTAINVKELAVGRALQDGDAEAEIRRTFEWVEFVPFAPRHGLLAGSIEADLRSRSSVEEATVRRLAGDVLIAAVAIDLGATVVTRNVADFERLAVDVESY